MTNLNNGYHKGWFLISVDYYCYALWKIVFSSAYLLYRSKDSNFIEGIQFLFVT